MRKRKGSLSIEAAIVVPLFAFLILFLANYIKLMIVYDNVQTGINNAGKSISRYSYLMESTGFKDFADKADAWDREAKTKETLKMWTSVLGVFGEESDQGVLNGVTDNIEGNGFNLQTLKNLMTDGNFIEATMQTIAIIVSNAFELNITDQAKELLNGALAVYAESSIYQQVSGGLPEGAAKAKERLVLLGVKPKDDGELFDFEATRFNLVGVADVDIIVSYDVSIKFMNQEILLPVTQRVYLKPWIGEQ